MLWIYIAYCIYIVIIDVHNAGMSAFSRWTYDVSLDLQRVNKITMDTTYQNTNLMPNRVYVIEVSPFFPRTLGPVDSVNDEFTTSWIVQTVEDGQCTL